MKFGAKEKDTYRLCMTIGVMLVISRVKIGRAHV